MFDTSYLYDPTRNRYKGVYPNRNPGYWDVIVLSPLGKLIRRGTFGSQEEAAQAVASYYYSVYGSDWSMAVEDRKRRYWRVRRMVRSSKIVVFLAEVRTPRSRVWTRLNTSHLDAPFPLESWSVAGEGWLSAAAAIVAIRIHRFTQSCSAGSPTPSARPSVATTV